MNIRDEQWIKDDQGRNRPRPSAELLDIARREAGNRLILGISGKDSLAMWLYLREHDFEIIPYMLWTVPGGLSFERESLEYYQDFFNVKIHFLPHPDFYKAWGQGDYQSPVSIAKQRGVRLSPLSLYLIEDAIAKRYNLGDNYLSAIGYRAADNPGRRRMINNMGALYISGNRHYYYACWDWTIGQVMDKIHHWNAKLSAAYALFGCTFDEYNWNDLLILQQERPDDYALLKAYFPLIGAKMVRFWGAG